MHEQRPSDAEGEYLPPAVAVNEASAPTPEPPPPQYAAYVAPEGGRDPKRGTWRALGGAAGAVWLLFAKLKGLLFVLLNLKWLAFAPTIVLKFGALFLSVWFYALFFGWKFGIVFVALILVHELGHYMTFKNFGIEASLPFFIPGFGAFVARRGPAPSLTIDAIATLAGPVYGLAASGVCYAIGISTHEPFWYAAAYLGFFLNALNLLPIPPLDGGGITAAIDPRLWILGVIGLVAAIVGMHLLSPFTIVIFAVIAVVAVPRIIALYRGQVDPRFAGVPRAARIAIAVAYFVTFALCAAGAAITHVAIPGHA